MIRQSRRGRTGLLTLAGAYLGHYLASTADAQVPISPNLTPPVAATTTKVLTPERLVRMGAAELDQLYRASGPGVQPRGRVKGIPIVSPGSPIASTLSRGARMVWQGKVFRDDGQSAVNRFFGVQAVRGKLYYGTSWVDGRSTLVLDYKGSSLVYGRYRDEIRQVGPNLYLGVMHARTEPVPTFTRYFAFEATR